MSNNAQFDLAKDLNLSLYVDFKVDIFPMQEYSTNFFLLVCILLKCKFTL